MQVAKCRAAKCKLWAAEYQSAGHGVPDGKVQKVVKQTSRCVPNCKVQVAGREVVQCKLRNASGESMLMAFPCCKCMLLSLSGLTECVCAHGSVCCGPPTLQRLNV